jgi:predicted aspartyl protease
MPSLTQRIPDLQKKGAIIEVTLTPSVYFMQRMKISSVTAKTVKLLGMIDTGATGSVVSQGIASLLGINPVGTTMISTPSSTNVKCNQYDVQIIFPNNVRFSSITVIEAPLQGQHIQCLIGRNILQQGVFIYNGQDNSFTLSL